MPKRKRCDDTRAAIQACLENTLASQRDAVYIWNAAVRSTARECITRRTTADVEASRLSPAADCYMRVPMRSSDASSDKTHIVWIGDLPKLLQWLASNSRAWRQHLIAMLREKPEIRLVFYSDEVTGGNILAPEKKKKAVLVYICLRGSLYHREACWITAACVQHLMLDKIRGGFTAVMREIVSRIHRDDLLTEGFELELAGERFRVRLLSPSLMISDHEVQRATFGIKGSAGLLPCINCCNVVSKHATSIPPGFVTIAESDLRRFVCRTNEAYYEAAAAIQAERTTSRRSVLEKAYGLRWAQDGLMFCEETRKHLPPQGSCTDTFHDYFCNGVASWECGAILERLQERGLSVAALLDTAVASQWHREGEGRSFRSNTLGRMLGEKYFDKGGFRGSGSDCCFLVPLLNYYMCLVASRTHSPDPKFQCFDALVRVCRELWRLQYNHLTPFSDHSEVLPLALLQQEHQEQVLRAYDLDFVKPKHHHRLHIPKACMLLGRLPNCCAQEKKHRHLKTGGLLDRTHTQVNRFDAWQQALLPRLLQLSAVPTHCFEPCELREPARPTDYKTKRDLGDDSLRESLIADIGRRKVEVGDVLVWSEEAGHVKRIVQGDTARLRFQLMRLRHLSHEPWGSRWELSDELRWYAPQPRSSYKIAMWWRVDEDTRQMWCLL